MPDSEFDIIKKYFIQSYDRKDVQLGIGDDCALLDVPTGFLLATTTDTFIGGVHFPQQTKPQDVAYKSIAVNLSDLAAMGATPAWISLALTIPEINIDWLEKFSSSFKDTTKQLGIQLIGGDTTRGALSITLHAMGFIDPLKVMRRDQAKAGDKIYVSGTLGDASIGLAIVQNHIKPDVHTDFCLERLYRPTPRIKLGMKMSEACSCAIDISDGLTSDITHILQMSECGAVIYCEQLPISLSARKYFESSQSELIDYNLILSGGDDYELCMVIPEENESNLIDIAKQCNTQITCIGYIKDEAGLDIVDKSGNIMHIEKTGYDHFNQQD